MHQKTLVMHINELICKNTEDWIKFDIYPKYFGGWYVGQSNIVRLYCTVSVRYLGCEIMRKIKEKADNKSLKGDHFEIKLNVSEWNDTHKAEKRILDEFKQAFPNELVHIVWVEDTTGYGFVSYYSSVGSFNFSRPEALHLDKDAISYQIKMNKKGNQLLEEIANSS